MRNNLRLEKEIMRNWKVETPVVSVCCMTYNHEKYIEDALEGFLIQETNFPYEVIIHDDASTDNTANIIREYEKAYPHIIKPIYQKENQYSRGVYISINFIYPQAKGQYISYCEGDDFWIDKNKLQTQIEAMQKYPDIDISFHPAKIMKNEVIINKIRNNYGSKQLFFSFEKTALGEGGFMPTESIIVRKSILPQIIDFCNNNKSGVGDIFIQIIASNRGGSLYLPQVSSVHRICSINSWSRRVLYNYPQRLIMYQKIAKEIRRLHDYLPSNRDKILKHLEAEILFKAAIVSIVIKDFSLFKILFKEATSLTQKINNRYYIIYKRLYKYPIILFLIMKYKILFYRLFF